MKSIIVFIFIFLGLNAKANTYSELRNEVMNCGGDETCMSLVVVKAVALYGSARNTVKSPHFFYVQGCDLKYSLGEPSSRTCPYLIQAHGKSLKVKSVKIDQTCHNVGDYTDLQKACLMYGPTR